MASVPRYKSRKAKDKESPKPEVKGAPEIKREEIEELQIVGSGQYGDVFKGRCRGYEVAIKILKNKFGTEEQIASFKREVEIMSRIRFPNVCLLLGACTDPEYFCIVQEYLPGGDLASLLEKKRLPRSFYGRMRLASQVARGMLWIHSNEVLHRDLKLENLLLDKHNEVKVCDFGLADNTGGMKFIWDEKGRKGSPLYMAPEVLLKKGINTKVDVYSFGLILWELLAEHRAFQHHLQHNDLTLFTNAICKEIERPPIPYDPKTTEEGWHNKYVISLIQRCWTDKARDRPDFQEIYDELNVLITEGFIKDEWGRSFWLVNFPDQDAVDWEEFVKVLKCKKQVQLEDGSTFNKGLSLSKKDPNYDKNLACLKTLLAQISGVATSLFTKVTCQSFGKLLGWFGPGVDTNPSSSHRTFLDRMNRICNQLWFHGQLDNPNSVLLGRTDFFLVRLSNEPGYFTIQTPLVRTRIVYNPSNGTYFPEHSPGEVHNDLPTFISNKVKGSPCLGSPFSYIYGTGNAAVDVGSYMTFPSLSQSQSEMIQSAEINAKKKH